MKQRSPKTLKKPTYCWAHKGCLNCVGRNSCVRASMLNQPMRKAVLQLLGYKEKPTPELIRGIKTHKAFFKYLKTLDEYGIKNFFKDLYSGKEIMIKEANICSPSKFLRGHTDCLKIKYNNNKYEIEIIELKPKFSKSYFLQVGCYALILSDPLCKIIYKKKIKKEHLLPRRLYPNKPHIISIKIKFIYYKNNKTKTFDFVVNNKLNIIAQGVATKIKKLRMLMRASINYLSEFRECDWCKKYRCDFKDICNRFPYSKSNQTYLGRKKLIIKNKPIKT